ncbi:hypothetical protein RSSM_04728 [Rhodopirellula sallentina SM41]|uniref:Uncharacterized protein n=1 Tax=Rhodopirellula sallentina SM41 TaxID=1263870 RepID=M5TXT9_9BACT|nr:hypothetical protein RSSM_04728 [Rhodopirellula sallentina SM41]
MKPPRRSKVRFIFNTFHKFEKSKSPTLPLMRVCSPQVLFCGWFQLYALWWRRQIVYSYDI